MRETLGAKSPIEFIRLLEESGILRSGELRTARSMQRETHSSKMLARRLVAKGILTRWQAGQLLVGWTKLRLGNHKLCRQVGKGEFGRVFLAEHIHLQREVAIKTLSRRFTQHKDIVERFLQDARQAAELDHRNLVHVLDIDSADDQYYMVMEYVIGQDLQRLVTSEGPLSPSQTADFLCQAADGLEYAHQAGLVHQAVSPTNLMVDEKGVIKVLGLGVGRLTGPDDSLAHLQDGESDEQLGDYRAPEQRCEGTVGDARCDIFSLGRTAVFLLTGQIPGDDRPDDGSSGATSEEIAGHWSDRRPDLPSSLVQIIEKMLAVDPDQRFATAREAKVALHDWLDVHAEETPALARGGAGGVSARGPAENDERRAVANAIKAAMSSDTSRESRKSEPRRRFTSRQINVFAAATVGGALLVVVAYAFWPQRNTTVTAAADRMPVNEVQATQSRSDSPLRRRKWGAKASETTLPEAGAGLELSQPIEKPSAAEQTPDEPAKSTTSSPTPEPQKPEEKPEPKPEVKPEPKPDRPAEPAAKKEPAPQSLVVDNPLRELPAAIDLGSLETSDAASEPSFLDLAPMTETLAQQTEIALLGGEHAAGKVGRFVLKSGDRGTSPSWTILLLDKDEKGETIGHLAVQSEQLRFTWDAAAAGNVLAPGFCNCVLRFTVGKHVHDMRLRTVQQVDPLSINLLRPTVSQRWPISALPDPQHVRFEILKLEDPFPAIYNLEPVQPIAANDEKVMVKCGSEDLDDHVLLLELVPQLGNTFRLDCKAYFQVSPELEPITLSQKNFKTAVSFVTRKQQSDNLAAQQARQGGASVENVRRLEAVLAETSKAFARMEALTQMREAMAGGAAIHFRLFYLADEIEVDLLRTTSQ